jgi:hypothetical protein
MTDVTLSDAELDALQASLAADFTALINELIPTIADEYRSDGQESDDDTPSMDITVGADASGAWSYQTGDNSFTGGAYGYAHWGVSTLQRDSKAGDIAEDLAEQIVSAIADDRASTKALKAGL